MFLYSDCLKNNGIGGLGDEVHYRYQGVVRNN